MKTKSPRGLGSDPSGDRQRRDGDAWPPTPIPWLLEGPAYVRCRTLVDLLGASEDNPDVVEARKAIPRDPAIKAILARRNADGYWGTAKDIRTWWPPRGTTFWVLGLLGDLGLTRDCREVARACEYVFGTQLPSGAFGWGPPPTAAECFTGILTEALVSVGCGDDPRVQSAHDWLAGRLRQDGGLWCKNTGQPGGPREREPSCAFATLCALGALTRQAPPSRATIHASAVRRMATFLLGCWDQRGRIKYAGHDSQIGHGWEKLKYPFTDYRILKYLDILSRIPRVARDPRMAAMVKLLAAKSDDAGRFRPESVHHVWAAFDFGQTREPSRWVTLLAHRIARRIPELRRTRGPHDASLTSEGEDGHSGTVAGSTPPRG